MEAITGVLRNLLGGRSPDNPPSSSYNPSYPSNPSLSSSSRSSAMNRAGSGSGSGNADTFAQQIYGILTPQYYNTGLNPEGGDNQQKEVNPNYDPQAIYGGIPNSAQQKVCNFLDLKTLKLRTTPPITETRGLECSNFDAGSAGVTMGTFDSVLAAQIDQYESLPTRVEPDHPERMTHNNMVPFYKGDVKQNIEAENRLAAQKLEIFTGQYKLRADQKKEVPAFFPPTMNLTNPNGSLSLVSLLEARGDGKPEPPRFNPNNTGKRNNELPFEQIRVGPGLDQGFTSLPSGGYHNQIRVLPKTGDQLYINPRIENEGRIIPGKALVSARGVAAAVHKYRPTLLVDNENGQRNFTTVGEVTGPRQRPGIVMKCTNRTFLTDQILGPAAPGEHYFHTPEDLIAKSKISDRQNFYNTPYRNVGQVSGKGMNDLGKCSYQNRPNEREVTGPRGGDQNFRSLTTWVKQLVMRPFDETRETLRQVTDPHPRPFANLQPGQPAKPMVLNNVEWQARTTIRETTEDNDNMGNIVAGAQKKSIAYDPQSWALRTTIKETTEDNDNMGNIIAGAQKKTIAYDPQSWALRTTIKETTEDNDNMGNLVAGAQKKTIAYDPQSWALRTTVKETTEDNDNMGNLVAGAQKKTIAYDPQTWALRTTVKETTEDNDNMGNVQRTTLQSGHGYQVGNWDPKNTQRQFACDYEYTGIANAGHRKNRKYDDAYNATLNIDKEIIARGREPTVNNVKLIKGKEFYNIEMKRLPSDELDYGRRVPNSTMKTTYAQIGGLNSVKNVCDDDSLSSRIDPEILTAFKRNPLTQSLSSY